MDLSQQWSLAEKSCIVGLVIKQRGCRTATAAHAPAPLIWCAGTELAAQSRSDGRLIAHTYVIFPLRCPICGGQMRLIAFITEGTQIRKILDHIGVDPDPPQISSARGPPLRDYRGDAQMGEGAQIEPGWATDWDLAA